MAGKDVKRPEIKLLPFQKEIIDEVHNGASPEVLFSAGRGNGKTFISAQIVADFIWEDSPHYQKGKEVIVVAGNLSQASILFAELQWLRESDKYAFSDSINNKQIIHKEHRTICRVVSSKASGALGLGANHSLIVADEAGGWEEKEGELMQEALLGALGKPGSSMKILWIGTIAPAKGAWWERKVADGTTERCKAFVYAIDNESDWDIEDKVLKANPLKAAFPDSKAFLLNELAEAKKDYNKSIYFKNWLLNFSTANRRQVLLTAPQIKMLLDRALPDKKGEYVLGLDLGDNVAFSAAAAIWESGYVEVVAACAGIPNIRERERDDAKPAGLYQKLVDRDLLHVVHNKHTVPPQFILDLVKTLWGEPFKVLSDQYRQRQLADISDWYIEYTNSKVNAQANFGIEAFREYASDGQIAIAKHCHPLLVMSLADARIEIDSAGLARTIKKNESNSGRDDVCDALVLAAALWKQEFDLLGSAPAVATLG